MTAPELARLAGITYRQLDLWCRSGYLGERHARAFGSGHQREFYAGDVRVVLWIASLVSAGFRPAAAAAIARGDKQARMVALTALTDGWLEESA